ncbi:hypothetical protein BV25DRAFT_1987639 [Artomyces pyxidatus]|uniref:Uncharacterized protein n=1 Tax=Artomyces pyxidatus TaxID=48021 RepID=A0ACB8TFK4_9AGAM|nr:hypothetical protein BV25DRAFT_1987639 [Artomyces pyxidatus]
MDNPQHYQPLSHALHPPLTREYPAFNSSTEYSTNGNQREEEEEEEEEVVEEELDEHDHRVASVHSSPRNRPSTGPAVPTSASATDRTPAQAPQSSIQDETQENKRRPGRPKGSRNRKPRESGGSVKSQFHNYAPPPSGAPPLSGVTPQNQQYYEFQWRVLNLCSEFYGAAEELVKGTPSIVIAQSYQMGPSNKLDPLNMLGEAKRICDQLLQNPSQLAGQTPPTIYPAIQYPQALPQTSTSAPAGTAAQTAPVITNPQTFVMSLGMPGTGPPTSAIGYPAMYAAPSRYPTAPYYQYAPAPGFYASAPAPTPAPTSTSAPAQFANTAPSSATTINMSASNPGGASGAWADDEVERLKKLALDSRSSGTSGEIDWDWVVGQWGNSRTRHQILLKATSLGLKESTTRGVKRRRETEPAQTTAAGDSSTSAVHAPSSSGAAGTTSSPAQSHTTASTPSAQPSPAVQYPRPPSSQAHPQSSTSTPTTSRPATASAPPTKSAIPWPMPTVAANTAPLIPSSSESSSETQRTNYYRTPRQSGTATKSSSNSGQAAHQYMYQPNGGTSNTRDSRG